MKSSFRTRHQELQRVTLQRNKSGTKVTHDDILLTLFILHTKSKIFFYGIWLRSVNSSDHNRVPLTIIKLSKDEATPRQLYGVKSTQEKKHQQNWQNSRKQWKLRSQMEKIYHTHKTITTRSTGPKPEILQASSMHQEHANMPRVSQGAPTPHQ